MTEQFGKNHLGNRDEHLSQRAKKANKADATSPDGDPTTRHTRTCGTR